MENNRAWSIILAVVVTAVVVGGGVYWWQSLQSSRQTQNTQSEIVSDQPSQETSQAKEGTVPSTTKTKTTPESGNGIFAKIKQELNSGEDLAPTKKPSFPLPTDIHEAQIDNYYLLGDVFVALVRRSSINVYLEGLPAGFDASFAGIIAADNNSGKWEKILTIRDSNTTDKNNPYAIWTDGGYKTSQRYLFLTVVDQNGAGSGEGIMKLLTSSDAKEWTQEQCYYFGANYNDPAEDGNYFLFSMSEISEGGSGFEKYSGKECNNFRLINE